LGCAYKIKLELIHIDKNLLEILIKMKNVVIEIN